MPDGGRQMRTFRFRTAKACEITRVDRTILNDVINSGRYACAPETKPRTPRIFSMEQMVTLFAFGQMVRFGIPTPRAADYATEIDDLIGNRALMKPESWWYGSLIGIAGPVDKNGRGRVMVFENGREIPRMNTDGEYIGASIVFDLENIWNYIFNAAELEERSPILGTDD